MAYLRDDEAVRSYTELREEQQRLTREIAKLRQRARTLKEEVRIRKATLPYVQGS